MGWLQLQTKHWEYRDLWSMKLQHCKKQCCQCGIYHRSIAQLFQDIKKEHCLWANHWLKRKDHCNISSIMVHYVVKEVFRMQKLFLLLKMWVNIILFVLQLSAFLFDEVLTVSNIYLNLESQALLWACWQLQSWNQ